MATTVVLNLPEHGHMNATWPVVADLVRRGERVVYFGTEPYRRAIEATGATYASYGDPAAFEPPAHTGGLYSVMAYLMTLAERVLPAVLDRLEAERPDYLLIDSMCVWGHLAQQVLRVPAATLASVFVPHPDVITVDEMLARAYGRAPKPVVLAGIDALNTYIEVSRRIDACHHTLSPNIVEFFAGRQRLNVLFTSRMFHLDGDRYGDDYLFAGPSMPRGDAPPVERATPPVVFVSLGTIFNARPGFFRACLEACRDRPWTMVMAAGSRVDRMALGAIPPNAEVHERVDQIDVLRRASAFVTHGGMNSVSEALWFGVPLVVFPQHGDQHLVAGRVAALGAGTILPPGDPSPEQIAAAIETALGDERLAGGARAVSASFHETCGPEGAAAAIASPAWRGDR